MSLGSVVIPLFPYGNSQREILLPFSCSLSLHLSFLSVYFLLSTFYSICLSHFPSPTDTHTHNQTAHRPAATFSLVVSHDFRLAASCRFCFGHIVRTCFPVPLTPRAPKLGQPKLHEMILQSDWICQSCVSLDDNSHQHFLSLASVS